MLSKLIRAGEKIRLQAVDTEPEEASGERGRVYSSRVHAILTEDTLEAAMPVERGQPVLLSVDREYNLVFCGEDASYQCCARITDRYRRDNEYMMAMELTSNLRKYQRREYHRFRCALEAWVRSLDQEEVRAVEDKLPYALTRGRPVERCMIVDISGEEFCFLSSHCHEPESLLLISCCLPEGPECKKYEMIGRVENVGETEEPGGEYRHQVQYYDVDIGTRKALVRYIFEEERKSRKKRGQ